MKRETQSQSDSRLAPIRPEILASKLAAIRNYEYPELLKTITERPRLVEMLWFIQAMSLRPGSLLHFSEELLAAFPERLGTKTMRAVGSRAYTLEERVAVWGELPGRWRPSILGQCGRLERVLADSTPAEIAPVVATERAAFKAGMKEFDGDFFYARCQKAAIEVLPSYLAALCTHKGKGFDCEQAEPPCDSELAAAIDDDAPCRYFSHSPETWFFQDVIGAMFELMDRRAAHVQKRLAMTEVAKQVFDALDFALAERGMVRIEGSSRFGKTEAMKAWCDMRPGLARLVSVPCSNSMNDLFKRIGEALGIDCSYGSNPGRLKERIEYVIQHSGLFLVFDEAAFLIPQNYSATTPPHRLNWVRTEIVDRNLPVAMAVTPQAFKTAVERFVKKTSYTMEQYLGRNLLTRTLPQALSEQDMISVARIHFPQLDEDALGYIASEARLAQNYLQAVEAIAKYARHLARGKARIAFKDIEAAVAAILPRAQAPQAVQAAPAAGTQTAARTARKGQMRPVNGPLTQPSRGLEPARAGAAPDLIFDARSLRGAAPERVEAELISAEP